METQHRATRAVAALPTPRKPGALLKLKSALELQERVKALLAEANEMVYTHLLPTPSTAKAPELRAQSKTPSSHQATTPLVPTPPAQDPVRSCCCCCCKAKHGGEPSDRDQRKTKSKQKKRRGSDTEDSDEFCSDGDERFQRAYQEDMTDEKLHQALQANRRRSTRVFERKMNEELASSPVSSKRSGRPSTPRGRSPGGRDDASVGGASTTSTSGRQHRKYSSASPGRADESHGRKRKRSPAERQASSGGHEHANDNRISKRDAARLTVEKVLASRKVSSQREFKIKWVELEKPSWITRRKCQPQVLKAIERFARGEDSNPTNSSQNKSGTESEGMYTVEKIIGARKKNQKVQYLVRWDGYDSSEDTWEYASELRKQVPEIVAEYENAGRRQTVAESEKETKTRELADHSDDEGAHQHHDAVGYNRRHQAQIPDNLDDNNNEDHPMNGSEDDDQRRGRSDRATRLSLISGGRFSKPLFVVNNQHADSSDVDHAHEDEDEDENGEVSDDFSGDVRFGAGCTGAAAVFESAKELLRRVRE